MKDYIKNHSNDAYYNKYDFYIVLFRDSIIYKIDDRELKFDAKNKLINIECENATLTMTLRTFYSIYKDIEPGILIIKKG